ncbi:hypothetical protein ARMGADRAFT_1084384 [Armillaria gallica]|uniref:F-box domain-containing protein n=1 Tax=Armillaria gallica TaxID=47427 RepID=A0A2H3D402_ARMGA|nr:hypothetical protein ARMGADRAFT_1084384 [Armillaria gallica]
MDSAEFVPGHVWNEHIAPHRTPIPRVPVGGINHLSSECLMRVFHFAAAAGFEDHLRRDSRDRIRNAHHPIPVVLSHVCPVWHALSISSASLWTNVIIDDHHTLYIESKTDGHHLFPIVDLFISLLQPQPLNVAILLSGTSKQSSTISRLQANTLGVILSQNSERLKSLTMRGMSWDLQYAVMEKLAGVPMPLLQAFTCDHGSRRNATPLVYYLPDGRDGQFLPLLTSSDHLLSLCPLLQDVCLASTPVVWNQFHASNLTTLVLAFLPDVFNVHDYRPSYQAIHTVLRASHRTLGSLTLVGILTSQQPISEAEYRLSNPFPMFKLEDLHIGYEDPAEVQHLLIGIAFPALKRLDLISLDSETGGQESGSSIVMMFSALIKALPLKQLISLKLHNVLLPACITEFPSVREGGKIDDGYVDKLDLVDQYEVNLLSKGDEGYDDNGAGSDETESYDLFFDVAVSYGVHFDVSTCVELTLQFFEGLENLRLLDVSEPDSVTLDFLHR